MGSCTRGGLIGCAALVALGLIGTGLEAVRRARLSPEQRQEEDATAAAARAKAEAETTKLADSVAPRLAELRARLPSPAPAQESTCQETLPGDALVYLPVDFSFLEQFTAAGYTPKAVPDCWYRAPFFQRLTQCFPDKSYTGKRDDVALAAAARQLGETQFLAVIYPLEQRLPVLHQETKSFDSGVFEGWIVLVDARTMTPLAQTKFSTRSSANISSTRIRIRGIPLGSGPDAKLQADFIDNFWESVDHAIPRLRNRPNSKASRTD